MCAAPSSGIGRTFRYPSAIIEEFSHACGGLGCLHPPPRRQGYPTSASFACGTTNPPLASLFLLGDTPGAPYLGVGMPSRKTLPPLPNSFGALVCRLGARCRE